MNFLVSTKYYKGGICTNEFAGKLPDFEIARRILFSDVLNSRKIF